LGGILLLKVPEGVRIRGTAIRQNGKGGRESDTIVQSRYRNGQGELIGRLSRPLGKGLIDGARKRTVRLTRQRRDRKCPPPSFPGKNEGRRRKKDKNKCPSSPGGTQRNKGKNRRQGEAARGKSRKTGRKRKDQPISGSSCLKGTKKSG